MVCCSIWKGPQVHSFLSTGVLLVLPPLQLLPNQSMPAAYRHPLLLFNFCWLHVGCRIWEIPFCNRTCCVADAHQVTSGQDATHPLQPGPGSQNPVNKPFWQLCIYLACAGSMPVWGCSCFSLQHAQQCFEGLLIKLQ